MTAERRLFADGIDQKTFYLADDELEDDDDDDDDDDWPRRPHDERVDLVELFAHGER